MGDLHIAVTFHRLMCGSFMWFCYGIYFQLLNRFIFPLEIVFYTQRFIYSLYDGGNPLRNLMVFNFSKPRIDEYIYNKLIHGISQWTFYLATIRLLHNWPMWSIPTTLQAFCSIRYQNLFSIPLSTPLTAISWWRMVEVIRVSFPLTTALKSQWMRMWSSSILKMISYPIVTIPSP